MSIGSNIKRRRMELGLSQKELARAVGYQSRSAIANIESGESELLASRLLDFAHALDTSVESLLLDLRPSGNIGSDLHREAGARNACVLLAGGKSSRNLQNVPNQFVNVLGRPVISWCLDVYQRHPMIDDIVVVCIDGWEEVVKTYADQCGITKLRSIVHAGESGVRSALIGLRRLEEIGYAGEDVVVIQESTRPLISQEVVSRVLLTCRKDGSAVTCGSMSDNVQFMQVQGLWTYVDRDGIVDLQSPDAYSVNILHKVFEDALQANMPLNYNSCAMLLYELGHNFTFCDGGRQNIKIVRQEDLAVFEALVRSKSY